MFDESVSKTESGVLYGLDIKISYDKSFVIENIDT